MNDQGRYLSLTYKKEPELVLRELFNNWLPETFRAADTVSKESSNEPDKGSDKKYSGYDPRYLEESVPNPSWPAESRLQPVMYLHLCLQNLPAVKEYLTAYPDNNPRLIDGELNLTTSILIGMNLPGLNYERQRQIKESPHRPISRSKYFVAETRYGVGHLGYCSLTFLTTRNDLGSQFGLEARLQYDDDARYGQNLNCRTPQYLNLAADLFMPQGTLSRPDLAFINTLPVINASPQDTPGMPTPAHYHVNVLSDLFGLFDS